MSVNLIRLSHYLKPDIGVIDGTVGLQGNGPGGTDAVDLGVAAASADVYAVDAVISKAMGFEPLEPLPPEAAVVNGGTPFWFGGSPSSALGAIGAGVVQQAPILVATRLYSVVINGHGDQSCRRG